MSSIDNRIVQMQFENSQFEKGVAESTKSLENFKKSLNFKGTNTSSPLDRMSESVSALSDRFSALGIIGKRVLENLADSAYRMGVSFVKSVSVDQITAGWGKYAEKTKAVQQIVNATGLSIEDVNTQLEKLNWFTDETSYSFTDMVSNIGKFTSMNIPLDKSVTAMQGISTWAALSGAGVQEASRAMYNLSQAIGLGSVKMQDWKSIALANMATAEFKQTAIDTAIAVMNVEIKSSTLFVFSVETPRCTASSSPKVMTFMSRANMKRTRAAKMINSPSLTSSQYTFQRPPIVKNIICWRLFPEM